MSNGFQTPEYPSPAGSAIANFLDSFGKTMANARQSELEMVWKKYQTDQETNLAERNAAQQFVLGMTPEYEGLPKGQEPTSTNIIKAPPGVQKHFGIENFQAKIPPDKKFGGLSFVDALAAEGLPTPDKYETYRINLRKQAAVEAASLNPKLTADFAGNVFGMNLLSDDEKLEYKNNIEIKNKDLWAGSAYPKPSEYTAKYREAVKKIIGIGEDKTKPELFKKDQIVTKGTKKYKYLGNDKWELQ